MMGGRRQHGPSQAGWRGGSLRRGESDGTGGKDASSNWRSPPRPAAKAAEHALPYNQRAWEVGGRREGGGGARSSEEGG